MGRQPWLMWRRRRRGSGGSHGGICTSAAAEGRCSYLLVAVPSPGPPRHAGRHRYLRACRSIARTGDSGARGLRPPVVAGMPRRAAGGAAAAPLLLPRVPRQQRAAQRALLVACPCQGFVTRRRYDAGLARRIAASKRPFDSRVSLAVGRTRRVVVGLTSRQRQGRRPSQCPSQRQSGGDGGWRGRRAARADNRQALREWRPRSGRPLARGRADVAGCVGAAGC
eukprot:362948-Chlamydomonas_euryale.AAC.1